MQHKFYITIGDWSDDGHGKTDQFLYESNYEVGELQKAYKKSCKKTGVKLHEVARDYEDGSVSPAIAKKLLKLGLDENLIRGDEDDEYWEDNEYPLIPEAMAKMIVWFIGLSMPEDFKCSPPDNSIPNFNGFWGELNVNFGYGLYY